MASLIEAVKNPSLQTTAPPVVKVPDALKNPSLPTTKVTPIPVTPAKKDLVTAMSNILPQMTYQGPNEFMTRIGDGCSKQAADLTQQLYGGKLDQSAREDAWYARKAVEKAGGKTVWTDSMKNDFSKVQIGSFVSLNRPGMDYEFKQPKDKSMSLKDNEKIEHRGVVVGFDPKDGMPLIRHGSAEGNAYVQRMDKLRLPNHPWTYEAKSIYTPKDIIGKEIVDKRYYTKPETPDVITYNPSGATSKDKLNSKLPAGLKPAGKFAEGRENEIKFISALNNNLAKQSQVLGLKKNEANLIAKVAFGIFNNESEAGYSSTPIGAKMLGSSLLHATGARKASPSLGDIQFKYDDLVQNADGSTSKIGKNLLELGVDREGLSNWTHHRDNYNDEVNAVASSAAATLSAIKANPGKYKYNPKTETIHGNIPLGVALAAAYSKGIGVIKSKEAMMQVDKKGNKPINYGTNAMKHSSKLNIAPAKTK